MRFGRTCVRESTYRAGSEFPDGLAKTLVAYSSFRKAMTGFTRAARSAG